MAYGFGFLSVEEITGLNMAPLKDSSQFVSRVAECRGRMFLNELRKHCSWSNLSSDI